MTASFKELQGSPNASRSSVALPLPVCAQLVAGFMGGVDLHAG